MVFRRYVFFFQRDGISKHFFLTEDNASNSIKEFWQHAHISRTYEE
ncbi:MAG: hypothetical protein ACI4M4_07230 [Candidatus Ornithospirochaeta sp.]